MQKPVYSNLYNQLVCFLLKRGRNLLNNTLQWFLIHYNQTPVQAKWHF
nr:MAG TPA: hypothetical protein [Caudoviricetes sp.]